MERARPRWRLTVVALALVSMVALVAPGLRPAPASADAPEIITGQLGSAYFQVQVPQPWNGTLVLWSHGYTVPGTPAAVPAVAPNEPTRTWLLDHGYALAASSYGPPGGWAVENAVGDQIALLDHFETLGFGSPERTIAWGESLGGIITAALVQRYPQRFEGALPLCAPLAGTVGSWNGGLDAAFVFKTLVAPDTAIQLTNITGDPVANYLQAVALLDAAQTTPAGRARIALAAAVSNVPDWYDAAQPRPARDDYAARQQNQYRWLNFPAFPFTFFLRQELETRAGGNPSWNTGVNYRRQLAKSATPDIVRAMYEEAGLSLEADLDALAAAPRIEEDPAAREYAEDHIVFNGRLRLPVLTLHTVGDGLVPDQHERAYAKTVAEAGRSWLLRQAFVDRAGHCSFTPAELVAGFNVVVDRLDNGHWGRTSAAALNERAAALGLGASAFLRHQPTRFLRPYDARDAHHRILDARSGTS